MSALSEHLDEMQLKSTTPTLFLPHAQHQPQHEQEEKEEGEGGEEEEQQKHKGQEEEEEKKEQQGHLCLQDLELVARGPEVGLGHRPLLGGLAHLNHPLLPLLLQHLRTLLQPRHLTISSLHEENKDRQLAAEEGGE